MTLILSLNLGGKTQNDTLLLKKIEEKNEENDTLNDQRNEIKALRAENQQLKALNFKLQNGRLLIYMVIDFFLLYE